MRLHPQDPIRQNRKRSKDLIVRLRPIALIAVLLLLWQFAVTRNPSTSCQHPGESSPASVTSCSMACCSNTWSPRLFRVTWGFALAACRGRALRPDHRLESPRRDGPQSLDSDPSPHLPAGLDSDRHPLVRRRRSGRHLSHLSRLLFPPAPNRHECGARHSRGLHQCRPQFRPFVQQPSSPASSFPRSSRS